MLSGTACTAPARGEAATSTAGMEPIQSAMVRPNSKAGVLKTFIAQPLSSFGAAEPLRSAQLRKRTSRRIDPDQEVARSRSPPAHQHGSVLSAFSSELLHPLRSRSGLRPHICAGSRVWIPIGLQRHQSLTGKGRRSVRSLKATGTFPPVPVSPSNGVSVILNAQQLEPKPVRSVGSGGSLRSWNG